MSYSITTFESGPIRVSVNYPRTENYRHEVQVDLIDLRAACTLFITYDFDRDGWVVKTYEENGQGELCDGCLEPVERAFIDG